MTTLGGNYSLVLTPPGTGAIGVIRVTGCDAPAIVNSIFRPGNDRRRSMGGSKAQGTSRSVSNEGWTNRAATVRERFSQREPYRFLTGAALKKDSQTPSKTKDSVVFPGDSRPGESRLRYGLLVADDTTIDDVVVCPVGLGEVPPIDIFAHGGVRIIESILQALETNGAPLADSAAGQVSHWPARNLIDEEAVQALSMAKTERAVRFLAWQRGRLVQHLERLADLCREDVSEVSGQFEMMLERYHSSRVLIDGATVAIVGPPNSGKSTLLNRLLGRPTSVVSPTPGTTRDWVQEDAQIDGVPIMLVDTAGQHEPAEELEQQAIRRASKVIDQANLRIVVLDGSQPLPPDIEGLLGAIREIGPFLTVVNKEDLGSVWDPESLAEFGEVDRGSTCISAATGSGVERLLDRIPNALGFGPQSEPEPSFFTERQRELAEEVLSGLRLRPAVVEERIRGGLIFGRKR